MSRTFISLLPIAIALAMLASPAAAGVRFDGPKDAADAPDQIAAQKPHDGSKTLDPKENPCREKRPTVREAWIDRLQHRVFRGVCGGAVWFDSFFGDEHAYDTTDLYGRLGLGAIYKTSGEYDGRSRFDANIPLPNMKLKTAAFVGRDNPNDYIAQTNDALAVPATFLRLSDEQSWLAGLGYTPSGRRLNRFKFKLGTKVSTKPYVFGQARYQYDHYLSATSALRLQETLFYRSSADGIGLTTRIGYDWLPSENFLVRLSSAGSITQDTDGVKWNSFATLYQDLSSLSGRTRGASYQFLVSGETNNDVPIQEYGLLGVYRQQIFRSWMFADVTLGYTFPRRELTDTREGAVNIGLVLEILFGNVPNAYSGSKPEAKPEAKPGE